MKKHFNIILLCICLVFYLSPAIAKELRYDLSTPEKAYKSFFMAVNNADEYGTIKLLSPRIKSLISSGELTIKQFIEAWSQYEVLRIEKPEVSTTFSQEKIAIAGAYFKVNGKEYRSPIAVININGKWLWHTK